MNSIQKNAAIEVERKTQNYKESHHVNYKIALVKVLEANPELKRRYDSGNTADVKSYADTLTAAQRAMVLLVNDPERTRFLASSVLNHLAHQHIDRNRGDIAANPAAAYRRALSAVRQQYPSLGIAAESGFIADTDFQLLALLIPAVGDVQRGNFSSRCSCGERKEYCRGKKLARQRGIAEESREFAKCILDAKDKTELDKLFCFFE